jgi:hypothetical protein
MLVGTTYPVTVRRLGRFFVGFSNYSWRMPAGVHGTRQNASRFEACGWAQQWVQQSLVNCCRQYGDACGECRRNYMTLEAPVRLRDVLSTLV